MVREIPIRCGWLIWLWASVDGALPFVVFFCSLTYSIMVDLTVTHQFEVAGKIRTHLCKAYGGSTTGLILDDQFK